jgi:Fe-S oxidoreductase
MAKASAEILNAGHLEFQISNDEWCCGSPIFRSGQVDEAIKYFEHNIELFSKAGIEEVITACPGCYSMFVAEYPKYLKADLLGKWKRIKFRHMVEVIDDLIAKKQIQFVEEPNNKRILVTYHDPCHLGRGGEPWIPDWDGTVKTRRGTKGIYKPPRSILKQLKNTGVELVEMFRINEYAYCCGSGGGVKAAYPEMALAASMERLEESEAVLKAKSEELAKSHESIEEMIIISACPFCKTNFEEAIKKSGKRIRYLDINQLVNERIKKEGIS